MKVKCFQLSSAGMVRDHNEDYVAFWQPEDFELLQGVGSIAVHHNGGTGSAGWETATHLQAGWRLETALEIFKQAKPETAGERPDPRRFLTEASNKVFQESTKTGRMSTTLLTTIFRADKATIAARPAIQAGVFDPGGKNQADDDGPFLHIAAGRKALLGLLLGTQRDDQPEPVHADTERGLRTNVPLRRHPGADAEGRRDFAMFGRSLRLRSG